MTNIIKCPVCNNPVKRIIDMMENTIMEEHIHCKVCGYIYDYAYGVAYEKIDNKEFFDTDVFYNCK